MNNTHIGRRPILKGLAVTAVGTIAAPYYAKAATQKIRVAKSIAPLLAYTPVDVGLAKGFFQKRGLEIEIIDFMGSSHMHQAMTAGALDVELGSGSTMVDVYKGEPSICVAETMGRPVDLAILVPYDSPIKTVDELKGKTVGISTVGSPLEWMLLELERIKGWSRGDIKMVSLGGLQGAIAALRIHQVDAVVSGDSVGYLLEPKKIARVLVPCSSFVRNFIMHANYVSKKLAATRPDAVRAFLAGWFEATAFMHAHKDEAMPIVMRITKLPYHVQSEDYDLVVPHLRLNGKFDPRGLAAIARSYVELGILKHEPNMSALYTEKFLPSA